MLDVLDTSVTSDSVSPKHVMLGRFWCNIYTIFVTCEKTIHDYHSCTDKEQFLVNYINARNRMQLLEVTEHFCIRFRVLTAASLNTIVFLYIQLFSPGETDVSEMLTVYIIRVMNQ
jgi:hypothetical protein